jgi:hypothetical protein
MKDGLKEIIGRQIASVVVAHSEKGSPRHQVFLVFTDGSNFELWGDSFSCCGGVDRTRDIERYVQSGGGKIVKVHTNPMDDAQPSLPFSTGPVPFPYHVPAQDSLEDVMTRELAAWNLAKQAICRARRRAEGR